jgi:hypothetical protein
VSKCFIETGLRTQEVHPLRFPLIIREWTIGSQICQLRLGNHQRLAEAQLKRRGGWAIGRLITLAARSLPRVVRHIRLRCCHQRSRSGYAAIVKSTSRDGEFKAPLCSNRPSDKDFSKVILYYSSVLSIRALQVSGNYDGILSLKVRTIEAFCRRNGLRRCQMPSPALYSWRLGEWKDGSSWRTPVTT